VGPGDCRHYEDEPKCPQEPLMLSALGIIITALSGLRSISCCGRFCDGVPGRMSTISFEQTNVWIGVSESYGRGRDHPFMQGTERR